MGGDTDPNMVHDVIVFLDSSSALGPGGEGQTVTAMLKASLSKGLCCSLAPLSAKMSNKRLIWSCDLAEKVAVITGSTKG